MRESDTVCVLYLQDEREKYRERQRERDSVTETGREGKREGQCVCEIERVRYEIDRVGVV